MDNKEFLELSKRFIFSKNKKATVKDITERLILKDDYKRIKYTKKMLSNLRKIWF